MPKISQISTQLSNPSNEDRYIISDISASVTKYITHAALSNLYKLKVNTVADLRLTEPFANNQIIELVGHTTAGVGGGSFYYDATDTTTADDSGMTIVTGGGKRWKRLVINGFIDSDMFGGDVKKLLPNATTKYAMKLMSDYSFSSGIICNKSDITIDCNGFKLIPTSVTFGMQIWGGGETGTPTALINNMLVGSNQFVTTGDYNIGDYVFIKSEALFPAPNSLSGKQGFIAKITTKTTNVVLGVTQHTYRVDHCSDYNFNVSDTATVVKCNMLERVIIDNFAINRENYTTQFAIGLSLRYVAYYKINNAIGYGSKVKYDEATEGGDIGGDSFIKILHCLYGEVNGGQAHHIGWYGLEYAGAVRDLKIKGFYGHDCRHATSANWLDGYGEPTDVTLIDCIGDRCVLSCQDNHDRGLRLKYIRCIGRYSIKDSGFQQRANSVIYIDCETYGNFFDGIVGRSLTTKAKVINIKSYKNLRNGVSFAERGVDIINPEVFDNSSSGIILTSGYISGGNSTGNAFSVRIPYNVGDLNPLVIEALFAPISNGANQIYIEDHVNYDMERLYLKSNLLYGFSETPLIATPTGDKTGKMPLSDGNNKTFNPTVVGQMKGRVTLSSGTATVNTTSIRNYSPITSTPLGILDNVRLKVVNAVNAGALRYTINPKTSFTITSTSATDASVIEWEITGF